MNKKRLSGLLILLVLLGILFSNGCKKSVGANVQINLEDMEEILYYIAETLCYPLYEVYDEICDLIKGKRTEEIGNYNEDTGWWIIPPFDTRKGQHVELEMQFLDDYGNIKKNYDNENIATVKGRGTSSDSKVTTNTTYLEFTCTDINIPGPIRVNGGGSANYQGFICPFEFNDIMLTKDKGHDVRTYPEGGVIRITIKGILITITFDGTRYALATFFYNGQWHTITIDLDKIDIP